MNSNLNKFDFDFGIGSSNRSSKPLNEQKNKSSNSYSSSSYSYSSYSSSTTSFSSAKPTPSWQPGKPTPAWTHQPAPSQPGLTRTELGGPASMVGDIKGSSWNYTAPAQQKVAVASSIGIVNKNPNLFGDLVSSAIGQNKGSSNSNAPLKSSAPVKNSFSMGGVANSLPKTSGGSGYGNVGSFSTKNGGNASSGYANVSSNSMKNGGGGGGNAGWGFNQGSMNGASGNASVNKGSGLGGSTFSSGGSVGGGMNSNSDPFGSFMPFSSKPMGSSVGARGGGGGSSAGIGSMGKATAVPTPDFDFGDFETATASKSNPSVEVSSGNDWEFDSGIGGGHDDRTTTELDGLPPPPAGVSASGAKTKGLDNYKQGQYADAIKWLSWADVLLGKAGDAAGMVEVLSCRASCYKEVGEYKKAVADCTKVLNQDEKNVAVLVQRALLYESMEKYRLGADDLRTVMKLDPGNRVARSTIHRLNKMADQ